MKAAITDGKGNLWLEEVPEPEPNEYQCLCKILACATCSGTDQKIIENKLPWKMDYPGILGHESIGKVIKVGSRVKNIKEGEIFFRPTAIYPEEKSGKYFSCWGGFAEYGLITDTKTLAEEQPETKPNFYTIYQMKIPSEIQISPIDATILITLKETSGFLMSLKVSLNNSIVILGSGPVAMSMTFFAKLIGAFPVIVISRRDESLERMKKFGANFLINNQKEDMERQVKKFTDGKGADYVIDTTGDEKLLKESLKLLSENGKLSAYASYTTTEPTKNLDKNKILQGVTGEVPTHNYMLDLVKLNIIPFKDFYSHVLPFDKIVEGFKLLKEKKAFKIVFAMRE